MNNNWSRRQFLATGAAVSMTPGALLADDATHMISKPIPSSGEALPIIGLGTYQVFDAASTVAEIASRSEIVERLTASGASLLDTSPMYNRSERMIGDVIKAQKNRDKLFLATKVWIDGRDAGLEQMARSAELMNTEVLDLMQVHNLRDTALHMQSIRELKDAGRIRYDGLTHYTAGAHENLMKEMKSYKPDFIQINYSLGEREAENGVLPLAEELGIAVLINRPFVTGRLFGAVRGKELPEWSHSFAESWGQFFLKFIVSHPAVTCVIPATSKPHHMLDNLGAGQGELPDKAMRQRMASYFSSL